MSFLKMKRAHVRSLAIKAQVALVAKLVIKATPSYGNSFWVEARKELAIQKQKLAAMQASREELLAAQAANVAEAVMSLTTLARSYHVGETQLTLVRVGTQVSTKTNAVKKQTKATLVVALVAVAVKATGKTLRVKARKAAHAAAKAAKGVVKSA